MVLGVEVLQDEQVLNGEPKDDAGNEELDARKLQFFGGSLYSFYIYSPVFFYVEVPKVGYEPWKNVLGEQHCYDEVSWFCVLQVIIKVFRVLVSVCKVANYPIRMKKNYDKTENLSL